MAEVKLAGENSATRAAMSFSRQPVVTEKLARFVQARALPEIGGVSPAARL